MRIHILQQDELVVPGTIMAWAGREQVACAVTKVYAGETLPELETFDLLIVLGGRMGAYDDAIYDWLPREKVFLREVVLAGKYVLGICLGAQLLAEVLGGKAYAHTVKEIGWWPVRFVRETSGTLLEGMSWELPLMQLHGDTFSLPEGAVLYASSEATENQAFIYKERVVGVQFHPEVEPMGLRALVIADELALGRFVQEPSKFMEDAEKFALSEAVMGQLLQNFKERISGLNK